jgi:hypothetical protein
MTDAEISTWLDRKRARQMAALPTCRHRATMITWRLKWGDDAPPQTAWQCDACGTYFPTETALDALCWPEAPQ